MGNSQYISPRTSRSATSRLRRHWQWAAPTAAILLGVLAWLAIGVFGVHTLFFDEEVNEAGPVFQSGAGPSGLPSDAITVEQADEMNSVAEEADMPVQVTISETEPEMAETPEITTLVEGSFVGRSHPAVGVAQVLTDGSEQRFLRFEDFATDNGPDLNVFLTRSDAGADASEFGREGDFVDLGDLKGNVGPQNYEIPPDVDLTEFDTVVIWCVRFGVAFGAADLLPPGA